MTAVLLESPAGRHKVLGNWLEAPYAKAEHMRRTTRHSHRLQQAALDGARQRGLAVGPVSRAAAGAAA